MLLLKKFLLITKAKLQCQLDPLILFSVEVGEGDRLV